MSTESDASSTTSSMYIAPYASIVNVHIYNGGEPQQQQTSLPYETSTNTVPTFSPIRRRHQTSHVSTNEPNLSRRLYTLYPLSSSSSAPISSSAARPTQNHSHRSTNTSFNTRQTNTDNHRQQHSLARFMHLLNRHNEQREENTEHEHSASTAVNTINNTYTNTNTSYTDTNTIQTNNNTTIPIPESNINASSSSTTSTSTRLASEPASEPASASTSYRGDAPPIFHRILSRTIQIPDLVQRLSNVRDASQQTADYTVSFELGTIGNVNATPPTAGLRLQDLSTHTTIGLFQDIDTSRHQEHRSETSTITESEYESEQEEDDEEKCSICQEILTPHSIVRQINRCNHFFHQACIEQWLCEHSSCPLCMQSIVEEGNENRQTVDENVVEDETTAEDRILNMVANELGM